MSPHKQWKIFLSDLAYDDEEEAAVLEVVRSRWLTMGPRTEAFEQAVADLVGAEHAVLVSSCTAGLYLMLAALDIGPGDEVLVPSLTFVATANVIVHRGATPIFCDIVSPELPLMDPKEVARNLSPATKAIMTVDYAGYPCDYDALAPLIADFEVAYHRRLYLLEDAAHGIGGAVDDKRSLGNCGDAGAYSFFSNKNVAIGEGGMVVTNQASIAERVRLLRHHGVTRSTWERHTGATFGYDVVDAGWNLRPGEIQAALGLAQVKKLEVNQWKRHTLVRRYQNRLAEVRPAVVPFAHLTSWYFPACHLFPILLPDATLRDKVREALQVRGIQTSHHYPPIHLFDYYRKRDLGVPASLPKTEEYAERELTLPLHPNMTSEDVDWIVEEIKQALTT